MLSHAVKTGLASLESRASCRTSESRSRSPPARAPVSPIPESVACDASNVDAASSCCSTDTAQPRPSPSGSFRYLMRKVSEPEGTADRLEEIWQRKRWPSIDWWTQPVCNAIAPRLEKLLEKTGWRMSTPMTVDEGFAGLGQSCIIVQALGIPHKPLRFAEKNKQMRQFMVKNYFDHMQACWAFMSHLTRRFGQDELSGYAVDLGWLSDQRDLYLGGPNCEPYSPSFKNRWKEGGVENHQCFSSTWGDQDCEEGSFLQELRTNWPIGAIYENSEGMGMTPAGSDEKSWLTRFTDTVKAMVRRGVEYYTGVKPCKVCHSSFVEMRRVRCILK